MTDIKTATGAVITIQDDAVIMITGPYPSDKGKRCYIHGVQKAAVPVDEEAGSVVANLHPKTPLAQLTRPDGSPVWVKGEAVSAIAAPTKDDGPGVGAVLTVGGEHQAVKDDVASVQKKLGAK